MKATRETPVLHEPSKDRVLWKTLYMFVVVVPWFVNTVHITASASSALKKMKPKTKCTACWVDVTLSLLTSHLLPKVLFDFVERTSHVGRNNRLRVFDYTKSSAGVHGDVHNTRKTENIEIVHHTINGHVHTHKTRKHILTWIYSSKSVAPQFYIQHAQLKSRHIF